MKTLLLVAALALSGCGHLFEPVRRDPVWATITENKTTLSELTAAYGGPPRFYLYDAKREEMIVNWAEGRPSYAAIVLHWPVEAGLVERYTPGVGLTSFGTMDSSDPVVIRKAKASKKPDDFHKGEF